VPVQVIEGGDRRQGVVPVVAHELADVGPVLLLDVGVVVLLVGSPPRELNGVGLAVPVEGIVDELAPVVGVNAPEREGQPLLGR
jgi:hypothetical protein